MIMPCDCRVSCPGTDSPFANLTSEPPDQLITIGYNWGNNEPGLGWKFDDPPHNPVTCDVVATQAEADLCAGRCQIGMLVGDPCSPPTSGPAPSPGPFTPWRDQNGDRIGTFLSEAAFCTVFCEDGLPFTYNVKAGIFRAFNQDQADEEAVSYACQQANLNSVCFTSISGTCLGANYFAPISVTGGFAPYTIIKTAGTLPPGVGFVQDTPTSAFLSGVPTTAGLYSITLRATDTKGNFMVKSFNVAVLDISNKNTMPTPVQGTFYNQALIGAGGTAPYTFTPLSAITLGLTLQPDGFLVGNPVNPIGTGFNVLMTDATGNSCQVAVTFSSPDCAFGVIIWDLPPDILFFPVAPNTYSFGITLPTDHSIRFAGLATMTAIGQVLVYANSNSSIPITIAAGPARNCTIVSTLRGSTGTNLYQGRVSDPTFATIYGDTTQVISGPIGVITTNFTIPAGVTQLVFSWSIQCGLPSPPTSGSIDIQIDFGV